MRRGKLLARLETNSSAFGTKYHNNLSSHGLKIYGSIFLFV
jgi:hypothetical protein